MNHKILLKKIGLNEIYIKIIRSIIYKCFIPYPIKKKVSHIFIKKLKENKVYLEQYRNNIEIFVYKIKKSNIDFNLELKYIIDSEINKIDLFFFGIERYVSFI